MTDTELIEAEQYARKYGPANCWTGTSGKLSGYVIQLIREVRMLRDKIEVSNGGLEDGIRPIHNAEGSV